jgi:hypothetical protein
MRSLILMTATLLVFGCSSTFAQVRSTSPRNAPAINMTSPLGLRATIPSVGASPGTALGTIQLNLGALAPTSGGTLGTITTCPTTGIAPAIPSTTLDASNAVGATGLLPPQLPPGATPSAASPFGTSIVTGACNPTAAAVDSTEALGNSVAAPIPGLATITGPAFSDATIPSAATEVGGAGLSPLIIAPTPDSSPGP